MPYIHTICHSIPFKIPSTQIIQFVFEISHRPKVMPFRRIWSCKDATKLNQYIGLCNATSSDLSSIQIENFKRFVIKSNCENLKFTKLAMPNKIIYLIFCCCYFIWPEIISKSRNLLNKIGMRIKQTNSSFITIAAFIRH